MAFFRYKAVTPDGKVVEGTLEAADQEAAVVRLQEQGQLPIKVLSGADGGLFSREFQLPWKRKRVPQRELLIFTQELSALVKAGLPLDRSLRILVDLTENDYLRQVIRAVLADIKGGKSLSEGLGKYPQVFPKVYVNMVKAGEVGGALDQILSRLVEYLEDVEEFHSALRTSMIYPAILTFILFLSLLGMFTIVIPQFATIFENAGAPIPLPMRIMLGLSAVMTGYGWIAVLGVVFASYRFKRYLDTEKGRLDWDRRVLELPVLGLILKKIEVSRFSRSLGTLLKSAVPLISSINIVKDIVGNRAIAASMEGIKSGVKKGEGLASPVRDAGVFPPFALHLLEVGEETGRLDDMLLQIAETYDREMRATLDRFMVLLGPVIILTLGSVIGAIIACILYSIMSINDVPL